MPKDGAGTQVGGRAFCALTGGVATQGGRSHKGLPTVACPLIEDAPLTEAALRRLAPLIEHAPRVAGPSHRGCPMGPHGRHTGIHGVETKQKMAPEDTACGAHNTTEDTAQRAEHTTQWKTQGTADDTRHSVRSTQHNGRRTLAGTHSTIQVAPEHTAQRKARRNSHHNGRRNTACGASSTTEDARERHKVRAGGAPLTNTERTPSW